MTLVFKNAALFFAVTIGSLVIFALGFVDPTLPVLLFGLPVGVVGLLIALRYPDAALLLLVFLIPLDFFGQLPNFSGSFSVFKLVFPLVLLSFVISVARGQAHFFTFSASEKAVMWFCALNIILWPFAANVPEAQTFIRKLISMALLYLLITRHGIADPTFRKRLTLVVVGSSALSVVIGMFGSSTGGNLFSVFKDDDLARSTGASTVSPNDFAYMMFLPAFIAFAAFLEEPRARRWLWLAASGVIVGGVVMTYSRSAFVAFVAGGFVTLLMVWRKLEGMHWLAMIAGLLIGVVAMPAKYTERLASLEVLINQRQTVQELSLVRRANYITVGMRIFKDHPILGAGPGNFAKLHADPHYQGIPFLYNVPRMPHNLYLQVLTETGLAGMALFLAAVWFFLRDARRAMRPARNLAEVAFAAAVMAALLSSLAMGLFLHLFINKSFWLMLAYARISGALVEKTGGEHDPA